jgi:uncharacterized protein Yka (UPF0111/DUF47 family)
MDVASLSDRERVEHYRSNAAALLVQAERASPNTRDHFVRMAASWQRLAASIEEASRPLETDRATAGTQASPLVSLL